MKYILTAIIGLISVMSFGQHVVSGVIEDTNSGKAVKDAIVFIEGTTKKTKTNRRGKFKIKVQDTSSVIVFSKEGYYKEAMTIGSASKIKVGLTKAAFQGEDVADSYGGQNTKNTTSAVTVIKSKDFNQGVVTDIYELLRGKVPGLVIRHDPKNPGAKPFIMLRGAANFSTNIEPLIVVDGVQNVSLQNVDPNDVASVSVLRDGSAQAMYGSQATGGVIIITTKKN